MKTLIISTILSVLGISYGYAQNYSVSTEPTATKVLLEEFTGVHCTWCSEGHQMAAELLRALPGESFVVCIHGGGYAATSGYEAGFTTNEGKQLIGQFGAEDAGYPCGMINRHNYSPIPTTQQYCMSRSLWLPRARELNSQTAPLNLSVTSSYDGATNQLKVHVEGYYTAQEQAAQQYLTVLWTQSDIKGYQKNGGKGNDYMHQHMLRGYLSSLWGDQLDTPQQGQYFSRDYTLDMPGDVNGVAAVPEDVEVIAFVSTGRANILQVAGCKPTYTNYGQALRGNVLVPDMAMGSRYGYHYFEAYVKSHTMQTITSATFDVTVNDQTQQVTVDCNIPQFSTSALLKVPATYTYKERGTTKYEVKLTALNGEAIDGGSISGSFQKPNTTDNKVTIELKTDYQASQNRFLLKDEDGTVLQEYGPFEDGQQHELTTTFEGLENGQTYCFEITDALGNGMLEGVKGSLVTRTGEGKLIDAFYTISDFGIRSFFTVNSSTGISTPLRDATPDDGKSYDLGGRLATGGKTLRIVNGKKIIK